MAGTEDATAPRSRLSGAWYLTVLLVAPTGYFLSGALFGVDAALWGIPWSVITLYAAAAVALATWIVFTPASEWSGTVRAWLMLGVVLWLFVLVSDYLQGRGAVGAALLVPLTYFLILFKRPSRSDVWTAADGFAWVVAGAAVLVLVLEVVHVIPSWYADHDGLGATYIPFDRANYWLPLRDLLGLDGRWGGTSRLPNVAGQAGALLVVYGMVRPIGRKLAFVGVGLACLLLTDSRTSYAAGAVGLILLALLPGWGARYRSLTATRVVAGALGLAMAVRVGAKVVLDPALTGRVDMWPKFLSLLHGNWSFGAGTTGIDEAIQSGELPAWAHQGHNLFLDALVRYGVVGLLLMLAFVGLAFVLAASAVRRELAVGLALIAALVMSCMGDLGIDWTYPSDGLSVLLVAVLLSQAPSSSERLLPRGS